MQRARSQGVLFRYVAVLRTKLGAFLTSCQGWATRLVAQPLYRLFSVNQHDGLRTAAFGQDVDWREPCLQGRYGRLQRCLIDIREASAGRPEGNVLETCLCSKMLSFNRDFITWFHSIRRNLDDLRMTRWVADRRLRHNGRGRRRRSGIGHR